MKTLILFSLGLLAIPMAAATISSGTITTCQSFDCTATSNNLTTSFNVSGSSLTQLTFTDLTKSFSIAPCPGAGCSFTINNTFTDTTAGGLAVSGSVVYNGTTYSTNDVNNVLVLTLTPNSGPLPGTVITTYTPANPTTFPVSYTATANGPFAMTGTITLVSFGNTIFTESLTGSGQVSIDQFTPISSTAPGFVHSSFTFTPEPASSVLMSSGFAALFLGVMLRRRSVSRS